MKDHSWAENSFDCACKRFQDLLYGAPTKVMIDRGETGRKFWEQIEREKDCIRALNQMTFNYKLYGF